MLSLGEQQRVAWLRLLLHAPSLAFLDEVPTPMQLAPNLELLPGLKSGPQRVSFLAGATVVSFEARTRCSAHCCDKCGRMSALLLRLLPP
jgi:ABC-type branched-subunit amino acid transport system ATPase component